MFPYRPWKNKETFPLPEKNYSARSEKDPGPPSALLEGFTLIEIIIVIGIITLITGIAVIRFQDIANKSKVRQALAEIEVMGSAIVEIGREQIEKDPDKENTGNNVYIHGLSHLASPTPPTGFSPWWGPYVSSLSTKDPWGNNYVYDYWTNASSNPPNPDIEKLKDLPPPGYWGAGKHYDWSEYYGGSYKRGFVLGSYGSDGTSGGTGYAKDLIYPVYTPPSGEPGGGGWCFIATAAYGSYEEPAVEILRDFRDRYLLTNSLGKKLTRLYYRYSPGAAAFIIKSSFLQLIVRIVLLPFIGLACFLTQLKLLEQVLILITVILIFYETVLTRNRNRISYLENKEKRI